MDVDTRITNHLTPARLVTHNPYMEFIPTERSNRKISFERGDHVRIHNQEVGSMYITDEMARLLPILDGWRRDGQLGPMPVGSYRIVTSDGVPVIHDYENSAAIYIKDDACWAAVVAGHHERATASFDRVYRLSDEDVAVIGIIGMHVGGIE